MNGNNNQTSFSGQEGEFVSIEYAMNLTANYRSAAGPDPRHCHFFGREMLQAILDHPACMGVRVYYGYNDDQQQEMLLVGTDANGNDIFDGPMVNRGFPCPPDCGDDNQLTKDL